MSSIKRHIICEKDVGLFSLIQQVISHVPLALSEGRNPVAFFGKNCCYWTPGGYQGRTNVWEYYFEPVVADDQVNSLPESLKEHIRSHSPDHRASGYFWDENTFLSTHFGDHRNFAGRGLKIPFKWKDPDRGTRLEASKIIQSFVRPRDYLKEKSDRFFSTFMKGFKIIGVHIRASDVSDKRTEHNIYRRYSYLPEKYTAEMSKMIASDPETMFFVATDSQSALGMMLELFGPRIISYSSVFHATGPSSGRGAMGWTMPGYLTQSTEVAARNGEEAVIDYLLLSKCKSLIHNGSGLARTVLLKNPEMGHINLHSRVSYLKKLFSPATLEFYYFIRIMTMRGIWRLGRLLKRYGVSRL